MSEKINDILYDTAEEVFENLAFVLTMPEGEGVDDFDIGSFEPAAFGEETEQTEKDPDVEEFQGLDTPSISSDSHDDETIVASIHFRGSIDGDLFLEASTDLLPVIGMNMLGLDDESALTLEEQKDAFCELLNVICGNLLPAVAGVKAVFNIDHTELHDGITLPETIDGQPALGCAHFGLEVGHAKLALFADERIQQNENADTQSCV